MNSTLRQVTVPVNDIFVDGFVARTFQPEDALHYFALLLRSPDFLRYYGIRYSQGAWYITYNIHSLQPPSMGVPMQGPRLPLDFSIRTTQGTVVPQRRWIPADEVDFRRHVEGATLQLPIFFVNQNGSVGFQLLDILQGCDRYLDNAFREAPLGRRTTTHIRINWPGYGHWKRQIPARDETHARNPITLARFMKHVGTSVDKFFRDCEENDHAPNGGWRIGPYGIGRHHVKVIGAVHVSAGSWMPIIQLTEYVV
ncbi:hypothetical protein BJV78DRAFT_1285887 [Lactifluus subvellereus]|nr:hypothetical protein BJV78DRAFT_1285887 [Lactifluus subvellereus]